VTAPSDQDAPTAESRLTLLDWKRRVFALYAEVRTEPDPERAWRHWRAVRDGLFRRHPQSPLPEGARVGFEGLPFFDYDPAARVTTEVRPAEAERYDIATSRDGSYAFTRFGVAGFELHGQSIELELYWLEGYGGGVFLPFRDSTAGRETYGAGRYLLDTVKGADLGTDEGGHLVLDFNFAYNPSCAYDPRWECPLAPPPNRLPTPIRAGERHP
jgi:uncharacterized protein (DUF1684 family)